MTLIFGVNNILILKFCNYSRYNTLSISSSFLLFAFRNSCKLSNKLIKSNKNFIEFYFTLNVSRVLYILFVDTDVRYRSQTSIILLTVVCYPLLDSELSLNLEGRYILWISNYRLYFYRIKKIMYTVLVEWWIKVFSLDEFKRVCIKKWQ